ncbi:LmbU family transcriptional regulator [[Actinomadura] parvosata]|uniref:LmbU family transcriptional regulator n=1 Tax=[Actinomadura] parvosata TaxID=1955412 RepID=UPI001C912BEB|nr:LmbU family transcriptional regulator [Nonomuraea sp. ATCC 55076]
MIQRQINAGGSRRIAQRDRSGGINGQLTLGSDTVPGRLSLRLPENTQLSTWSQIGQRILLIGNSTAWWLGDWLIFGQDKFPKRYQRAIQETSLDYQTLRNYAWVARRFPVSRRRDTVSFQHHAAVAALPEAEQDLWLDRATAFGWSLRELRKQLRAARAGSAAAADNVEATLRLKVSQEKVKTWQAAAAAVHQDVLEWMVAVMDRAAGDAIDPPDSAAPGNEYPPVGAAED